MNLRFFLKSYSILILTAITSCDPKEFSNNAGGTLTPAPPIQSISKSTNGFPWVKLIPSGRTPLCENVKMFNSTLNSPSPSTIISYQVIAPGNYKRVAMNSNLPTDDSFQAAKAMRDSFDQECGRVPGALVTPLSTGWYGHYTGTVDVPFSGEGFRLQHVGDYQCEVLISWGGDNLPNSVQLTKVFTESWGAFNGSPSGSVTKQCITTWVRSLD